VNTRRITLIVAVILAVGTGILTLRYLSSLNQSAPQQQAQVELKSVVITNRDIPVRAKITPDMLTKVTRPATEAEPQAISDPHQAEGQVALIAMPAGSTVTLTKIGEPGEVGLTARLKPGMRAVSIPVDRVKAVSNLIQPGDRVDVLAAVTKGNGIPPKTFTIIRGALVLAINSQLEQISGNASPAPGDEGGAATVTLGVSPAQADLLTVADLNSTIRLALRSPQEPVSSLPAETLTFADLGAPPAPAAAAVNVPPPVYPVPAPTVAPAKKAAPLVPVIDGDHFSNSGS
jgi:pilus assembly protein CpaB